MQKISFIVDGQKLHGTLFYPEKIKSKNPAILFVHGWTSEQKRSFQYAEALAKLGFICFLFDMRGHGISEGDIKTFTIRQFFNDVLAAYDCLSDLNNVDKENISAIGLSFGGYLIALLSAKRKVKNLSMRVPADYPNEQFDELKFKASGSDNPEVVTWRNKKKSHGVTFALQAIHNFNGNKQIIESEKDTVVPQVTIQNYINAVKDKHNLSHIVVKDAPHTITEGPFRDQIEKILVRWFKDKVNTLQF